MSAWKPPVSTGFLFTTRLGKRLYLFITNMLRLSAERKLTRKMPNGLLTCLSMSLLPEALCQLLIFDSFVPHELPFQTDLLQVKRKESSAELFHGFQYPVGKRCFGHLRKICSDDTG